jgi:DNA-binding LacI/PurR family transcriptional regulator
MAKLADIAKRSGMARSTVAAILRGAPGFNELTRERVLNVAQELGYRPNYLSKALAGGRSMTLGMMVSSFDPALMGKVQAFETAARKKGYLTIVVFEPGPPAGLTAQGALQLLDRHIDGLVVFTPDKPEPALEKLLEKTTVPTVFIDWAPAQENRKVTICQNPGMQSVAQHLAALGHRQAVFIGVEYDRFHPEHKVIPYQKAFEQAGMRLVIEDQLMPGPDEAGRYEESIQHAVEIHFKNHRSNTTAIVTCDDIIAIFIVNALKSFGLAVPQDVSVVGFDDHPVAAQFTPALTTLRQPGAQVGLQAFEMLEHLLNGKAPQSITPVAFNAQLIARQSTSQAIAKPRKTTK